MPDRAYYEECMSALETERLSWWQHWRELANYILPRRYRWLITPNELSRGLPQTQYILDSTGTVAARTLSAGMMAGNTSPARPWFKLKIDGVDSEETSPATIWLAEVQKRMMEVFHESNFYNSIAVFYGDLSVFCTATMLIYEDYENIICCYNPCAGEYYLANNAKGEIGKFYRKFTMTASQMREEYGEEAMSPSARNILAQPAGKTTEFIIAHAIEPNDPPSPKIPKHFAFREVYWEWGSPRKVEGDEELFLRIKGFEDFPAICARWEVSGNDAYGRGPAMEALGDIKQLQQETKRKAQAIDKMVNPPLLADAQLRNQPASVLPGALTYVSGLDAKTGMRPVYTVAPPVQEIMLDIQQVQQRIKSVFYNDLFMMFQELQAEPRSAAAVDVRREEKLIMLGPVTQRVQREALSKSIDRTFNIMLRKGILPPPPMEIQGRAINIEYVSMLAEAQRTVATAGLERLLGLVGNIAAAQPNVLDKIDMDEAVDKYGNYLSVDPEVIRSDEAVAAMRAQRAQQEQQIALAQATQGAVGAAKTLSETEVGAGQNALQLMMGQ